MNRGKLASMGIALTLLLTVSGAQAHNLWLNPSDHFPRAGDTVDIGIGWGHEYTASRTHQEVKDTTVEEITALDPDGGVVPLERASAALYRLKVEKPGVYLVSARVKPGVFTITPEGRKWANKKEVENPGKCTAFHISAKTVLVVGGSDRGLGGLAQQPLEVTPLVSPATLKKGTALPVKIWFEGKPIAGLAVRATYAGHEAPKPAEEKKDGQEAGSPGAGGGHAGGGTRFPVETVTDAQGHAIVPVDREGYWMINLSHKPPYPDPQTCDEHMFNHAFTFQVQ
ncbi:MAG: DUF4198 domain-containing protein [Syntrophobacteraceae bacterium]|jgi:uncharacterized GH25 family protein|nr:DUF4198 domain-containing protein [Syntrophobacteraceae bacterium]